MTDSLDGWEIAARLGSAVLAGGVLGWERELQDKPAGLRTHMMVSLGAAVPIIAALHFQALANSDSQVLQIDPFRIVQGIMGGIGFLGAGAIIQSRRWVHGLTTAATIWVSAAIGVVCGFGYYLLVGTATGMALMVLLIFGYIEGRFLDAPTLPDAAENDEPLSRRITKQGAQE
jgi:putative Mg2+ transporter-C (MgtC) family protein